MSADKDAVSRLVVDPHGNIWRHYHDVGWVRLITQWGGAIKDRADLEREWGPLTDIAIVRAPLAVSSSDLPDGNGMHVWLDAYEIANLKTVLDAVREVGLPVMNGDWFEQIRAKLSLIYTPNNPANATAEQIADRIRVWTPPRIPSSLPVEEQQP